MKALIERAIQQKGGERSKSGTGTIRMWQEGVMSAWSLRALPGSVAASGSGRYSDANAGALKTHANTLTVTAWQEPPGTRKDRLHISHFYLQYVHLCAWQCIK